MQNINNAILIFSDAVEPHRERMRVDHVIKMAGDQAAKRAVKPQISIAGVQGAIDV